jgi:membrane protease subunit HflK
VDFYGTGIKVIKVNILHAKPPEAVKDAFDDVTQAREDEVRLINEAEAYRNEVVPKARGAAARLREEADAYNKEVTARAEGEADRFSQLLKAYERAPGVTRDRLYLDMMESVLTNSSKVLVDVEGNNNLLYLPLDKLMSRSATTGKLSGSLDNLTQQQDLLRQVQQQTQRARSNLRTRESR